jgi:site-specific DNA recombinase
MSSYGDPTEGLDFGALVRVSTERQEKQGESLATQRASNARDVETLGGTIVAWYGGQEHATEGYEHQEVDRLVKDAAKKKFDAVMVAYVDRWSRQSAKFKAMLETFRKHGVRFFVGRDEKNLFDPAHRFELGIQGEVAEFIALQQAKKSIENRIERAKKGVPVCGSLPFGRTWDPTTGWGIDREKQAMLEEIARRYLAGESLIHLANEFGVNHSNLHLVLMERCGEEWWQTFNSARLNIQAKVKTTVPRLLPEETIKKLRERAEGNKTYSHTLRQKGGLYRGGGKREKGKSYKDEDGREMNVHSYLLSRVVFCGHCRRALSGWANGRGDRYYRHLSRNRFCKCDPEFKAPCTCCHDHGATVRADDLEEAVLADLFDLFGNPAAVQRAIDEATPNLDKLNEYRERVGRLEGQLAEVEASRQRVIRLVSRGSATEEQADKELAELRDREASLKDELNRLNSQLTNAPSPEEVKRLAEQVGMRFRTKMWAVKGTLNHDLAGMSWEDKRALVQTVFAGKTADSKRMGVYVERLSEQGQGWKRKQTWRFRILGRVVVEQWGRTLLDRDGEEPLGGPHQKELLENPGENGGNGGITNSAPSGPSGCRHAPGNPMPSIL